MIAVDTNILVYAHREDSEFHKEALKALIDLAEGSRRWAIPWPCIHEFIAITTHPSIYVPPTPLDIALQSLQVWLESAMCQVIGEGPGYFARLQELSLKARVKGPAIHDARIAAICLYNGVTELWTMDRDFSRYVALKTVNPVHPKK